ncbi:MAG TPA: DUF6326 family protein [Thermoplasmata archaeon]|jgi:hypothetical protein|nr:DUF6326 family protein [Thermoplasmata archaeon]
MHDRKSLLSTLWLFAVLNFVYCDVITLYDHVFIQQASSIQYTQSFLLGAAVLVEIPIVMVLLSRVLKYPTNRWVNVLAGALMTGIQAVTLFVGTPTPYYVFFSVIEIATTATIVWFAWMWRVCAEELATDGTPVAQPVADA